VTENHKLSVADMARLLDLITALADQGQCTPSEAIAGLEKMLAPRGGRQERRRAALTEFVARMRRLRLQRNQIIGAPLFRDPAWDMLLELFVSKESGRRLSVSSLCLASGVPPTTALRHLSRLEKHGLITRTGDPDDNRRWFVEPTEKAIDGIEKAAALLVEHSQVVDFVDG